MSFLKNISLIKENIEHQKVNEVKKIYFILELYFGTFHFAISFSFCHFQITISTLIVKIKNKILTSFKTLVSKKT